ncbi:cytochrome c biogenesis protein CcsA [Ursidibacter maritimus]|uniref:Cytochrome c biogenesis protein CcsA n=1 Tax=Ursidibacter maritimus TaxID=1331689 RepID=A0A949SXP4_9PAST|nr:cytochrome c biogenesis protein CcsA [Ursidibacter maritimus]KAE9541990.1 ABC transporter permease [Ursidibacter maritimus]MBV6523209.1 cytochrome c biogenesis protein CcsA [Ursidibacter maritimus]MBV6525349.1 cytochrome c biogenesis protein CcsA [Ursidibacter maritimus]MBV6527439.1 cytochrome c biogenesis protein CcsA [Ursidibacter maritimus]MBV6529228.1 cytochrome c biogenesis protein CcsA [Ursidibacter maritimus]
MLFAILAILTYLGALLWITLTLAHLDSSQKLNVKAVFILGSFAVIFHSVNISQLLFVGGGQNFTIMNVGSLISVSISGLATLALLRWKTIWFPLSIIYAMGIVHLVLSTFVEGSFIKQIAENTGLMLHLAIAIFSYALFSIALLYAFQLKWLDSRLKRKKNVLSPVLPPLMTVNRHFFTLNLVAQFFLTLTLLSGMIYLQNFLETEHIHKAIFSFMAWIVYGILLLGQWKLHWRGNRVLIYSISGMMLLTFAYFGSRMV